MGMDVTGNNDKYFRANCWSWRPIMEAMWESGACYCISEERFDHMHFNDGSGAETEEQCLAMATKLEEWIGEVEWSEEGYWVPEVFAKDTSMLVNAETGSFVSPAEAELQDIQTVSPYRVYKTHLKEWIEFLKDCGGGFEVW